MSYQIMYDFKKGQINKQQNRRKNKRLTVAIIVILLTVILRISSWDNAFWEFLIPGNENITKSALQDFTDSLENGQGFSDAVFVFCDAIIQGAKFE